jgi:patatin-like phospholipase/acyl hydrolase
MKKTEGTNKFHILALSGGGFKGLFTAVILEKLEENFGCPIAKKFDLLAGTSIGGIIALALADEIPAKTIKELFINNKEKIFGRPFLLGYSCWSKYSNESFKECLVEIFKDRKIKDLKHRIIIPTINYTKGSPQILKTRHHKDFKTDINWPLIDAALATSAAPVYFPMFRSDYGDFIDGGIVANHPGFFAYIEAQKYLNIKPENIIQLHIGTISHKITSSCRTNTRKNGLLSWREKLLDLLFSCQEQSTEQILSFLLKDKYYSINSVSDTDQNKTIALDKASIYAQNLLTQKANEALKIFQGNQFYENIRSHDADNFEPIPLDGGTEK